MTTIESALRTSIAHEAARVVLAVSGPVDVETAPLLRAALATLDPVRSNVVVDLTEVDFVDSAGINVLAWARTRFAEQGRRLVLRGVRSRTGAVMALGGLFEQD